jgi:hypothetical protein
MSITRYIDLDGTLAHYDGWKGVTVIGPPIPKMLLKVNKWLAQGDTVKIFTTRVSPDSRTSPTLTKPEEVEVAKKAVEDWCVKWLGVALEVTSEKGFFDITYDDKAEHIVSNTGETKEERMLGMIERMRQWPNHNDTGILEYVIQMLKLIVKDQNE